MIMRKETPGITAVAVVLPYGAPGTLGEIRAPLVPEVRFSKTIFQPSSGLSEPGMLGGAISGWRASSHDLS